MLQLFYMLFFLSWNFLGVPPPASAFGKKIRYCIVYEWLARVRSTLSILLLFRAHYFSPTSSIARKLICFCYSGKKILRKNILLENFNILLFDPPCHASSIHSNQMLFWFILSQYSSHKFNLLSGQPFHFWQFSETWNIEIRQTRCYILRYGIKN